MSLQAPASLPPIRTSAGDAKSDLDSIGLTRIAGVAGTDLMQKVRSRLIEQAAGEIATGTAHRDSGNLADPVEGAPNQRVWNLVNKGRVFRELLTNSTVLELMEHLLGPNVLLFSITANIACRGGEEQGLHGDQVFAPPDIGYPLVANCLWMLDAFTHENGATRVVPGSHLARQWPADDQVAACIPATGPEGTAMIWDGRLWHGTGANRTDAPRHGILAAYCRPFIRPQENHTVSLSPEVLSACSSEMLALLGFAPWMGIGMIDGALRTMQRGRPMKHSCALRADGRKAAE
jgi:ectoine hydroxylase-related dioxygenase (phytanoyl-CoA dioxygenase family)